MKKTKLVIKKVALISLLANKLVKHISNVSNKNVKKKNNNSSGGVIGGFGSLFDISK